MANPSSTHEMTIIFQASFHYALNTLVTRPKNLTVTRDVTTFFLGACFTGSSTETDFRCGVIEKKKNLSERILNGVALEIAEFFTK